MTHNVDSWYLGAPKHARDDVYEPSAKRHEWSVQPSVLTKRANEHHTMPRSKRVGVEERPMIITTEYTDDRWSPEQKISFLHMLNFLRRHGIDNSNSPKIQHIREHGDEFTKSHVVAYMNAMHNALGHRDWQFAHTVITITPEYLHAKHGWTLDQQQMFSYMVRFMCFNEIGSSSSPKIQDVLNGRNEMLKEYVSKYVAAITEAVDGNSWVIQNCASITHVTR